VRSRWIVPCLALGTNPGLVMKEKLLGVVVASLLSIGTVSELRAATLLGDVIFGSYDFPCIGCTLSTTSNGGITYFANPFVVDGNVETVLFIGRPDSYMAWSVRFGDNSLTLTGFIRATRLTDQYLRCFPAIPSVR
jgi:hypothetical protein